MRKLLAALCVGAALFLAACGSDPSQPQPTTHAPAWSSGQQMYMALVSYQALQGVVGGVVGQGGLSARDNAVIRTGEAGAAAGILASYQTYKAGAGASSQAMMGVASAATIAATNVTTILTAAHGDVSPNVTQLAVAGGINALMQIPLVLTAVEKINGGFEPSEADFAAAVSVIQGNDQRIQGNPAQPTGT